MSPRYETDILSNNATEYENLVRKLRGVILNKTATSEEVADEWKKTVTQARGLVEKLQTEDPGEKMQVQQGVRRLLQYTSRLGRNVRYNTGLLKPDLDLEKATSLLHSRLSEALPRDDALPWDIVYRPTQGSIVFAHNSNIGYEKGSRPTRTPIQTTCVLEKFGIADGVAKTDSEVATIYGISPSRVNYHVQVFGYWLLRDRQFSQEILETQPLTEPQSKITL